MEQIIGVDSISIISFIVGIISVVLAIISIIFSILFYRWSKMENDNISSLTIKIEEKVACLEKLFDKMYDSTYSIVRDNNKAMQNQLFPGAFETKTVVDRDMDIYLLLGSRKSITKEEICTTLKVSTEDVNTVVERMIKNGKARVEQDGNTIIAMGVDSSRDDSSSNRSEVSAY